MGSSISISRQYSIAEWNEEIKFDPNIENSNTIPKLKNSKKLIFTKCMKNVCESEVYSPRVPVEEKTEATPDCLYEGGIQDSKRSGYGKCIWKDYATYQGGWENDLPNGNGRMQMNSGSFYIGEFLNGNMHGKGEYHSQDGTFYKGDMHNNQFHGYGMEVTSNGEIYEGEFREGTREGNGRLQTSHQIYEGHFSSGLKDGSGILIKEDGTKTYGHWCKDILTP